MNSASLSKRHDKHTSDGCSHSQCVQNLRPVVDQILSTPGVTEQRDGRRDTPLMLARKRGLADVEQQLLAAGAKDLPGCSPSAARSAWSAGTEVASQNLLLADFMLTALPRPQQALYSVGFTAESWLGDYGLELCLPVAMSSSQKHQVYFESPCWFGA